MSDLDRDAVFDLLASRRRRQMLAHLDADGPATLRELAKTLTAAEEGEPVADLPDDEIRRVYISLYQYHLPNLEDLGVVTVDDDGDLWLTDRADLPLAYLRFSPDEADEPPATARGLVGGDD